MDLLIADDPVLRARTYLSRYLPNVQGDEPPGWAFDGPLVVLQDGGGPGEYSRVLMSSRLTVRVSAPGRPEASQLARRALALLRAWQDAERGVHWQGVVGHPAYSPEAGAAHHEYVFTVALALRASVESVDPL